MNARNMTELERIRQRMDSRPGEPNYSPGYQFRAPYEDVKYLLARVEMLEKCLEDIHSCEPGRCKTCDKIKDSVECDDSSA